MSESGSRVLDQSQVTGLCGVRGQDTVLSVPLYTQMYNLNWNLMLGVGLASLSASFVHATDQSHTQDSANLQHFYFLPETSWSSTVISATMGYNLQYNNVARQAEGNFCSYYQIEGNKNAR